MSKRLSIFEEKPYGYKVRGWDSEKETYEHSIYHCTLANALQDAQDFLQGEEKMICKDDIRIKVGDKVRVTDDRWALELRDGLLRIACSITQPHWKVVAIGHKLPTPTGVEVKNDTIITDAAYKRRIVFIKHEFLELVDVCPNCGARIKGA